jgi:hypothetical protein
VLHFLANINRLNYLVNVCISKYPISFSWKTVVLVGDIWRGRKVGDFGKVGGKALNDLKSKVEKFRADKTRNLSIMQ